MGQRHISSCLKTIMYLWASLYYHAILLTFSETRECHKKDVHKSQQLEKKKKKTEKNKKTTTARFPTDTNNENVITCH